MSNSNNNEKYSVSITLTSEDFPSRGVSVSYSFSHDMVGREMKGEELPASYNAAQDVATFLRMAQSDPSDSFNHTDEELAAMSPEQRDTAIREAAASAVHTVRVKRIKNV